MAMAGSVLCGFGPRLAATDAFPPGQPETAEAESPAQEPLQEAPAAHTCTHTLFRP